MTSAGSGLGKSGKVSDSFAREGNYLAVWISFDPVLFFFSIVRAKVIIFHTRRAKCAENSLDLVMAR